MEPVSKPMRTLRMLFRIAFWIGAPLVALIGTAFVYSQMVNWNDKAKDIAAEVRRATGRTLFIEGEVDFKFFPRPTLTIQKARLDNIPNAANPSFLTVPTIIITPSLISLLSGGTHADDVTLINPTFALEILKDGRKTWDMSLPVESTVSTLGSATAKAQAPAANVTTGSLPLNTLTLKDATFRGYNKESGYDAVIGRTSGVLAADAIEGPFRYTGTFTRDRDPVDIALTTGTWPTQGAVPVNLTIKRGPSEVSLGGTVTRGGGAWQYAGKLDGMVEKSLLPFGARLGDAAPAADGKPAEPRIKLSAEVKASPASYSATNIAIEGGAVQGLGEITLNMSKAKPALSANLVFNTINIGADKLLPDGASTFNPALPSAEEAKQDAKFRVGAIGFGQYYEYNLMKDVDLMVDVSIKQANFRNEALQNWRINLISVPSGIEVRNISATLPGNTPADVRGYITDTGAVDTMPLRFSGQVRASGASFLNFLKWLQVDLPPIPEGRLGAFAISANVILSKTETMMPALLARFDDTTITGGNVQVKNGENGSTELTLTMDKLNLDNYLPKLDALIEEAGGEAMDEQYKQLNSTLRKFDLLRAIQMTFGSLQLNLTVKDLVYKGETIDEAGASIRFGSAQMELENMRIRSKGFDITGKMSIDASQLRPQVDATLDFNDFNTANVQGIKIIFAGRNNTEADGLDATRVSDRWSKELIELRDITVFDGKVRIFFKSLTHQDVRFENVTLSSRVQDGSINIDSIRAEMFGGGKLDGKAVIGVSKSPSMSLSFALANASVKQALEELFGVKALSDGRFSLSGSISSLGADVRSIVSRAEGSLNLVARGVRIEGFDLVGLGQQMGRMLSAKQLREVTDQYLSQGHSDYDYVAGTLVLSGGVIGLNNTTLSAVNMPVAEVQGQVDVSGWKYDIAAVLAAPSGEASRTAEWRTLMASKSPLAIPVRINGAIDNPNVTWERGNIQKFWEKRFY